MTIPILKTHVGFAWWDHHEHFGFHVEKDLSGSSLCEMLLLAVLGVRATPEQVQTLNELVVAITVSDPRIWPLRLARIASSYGRAVPALSVVLQTLDHAPIGPWTAGDAADTLKYLDEINIRFAEDAPFLDAMSQYLKTRPSGFGVPFRPRDERVDHLSRFCVAQGGLGSKKYWTLLQRVLRLTATSSLPNPNIGLASAALMLDVGIPAHKTSILLTFLTMNIYLANAVEGAEQAPAIFRQMPATVLRYEGPKERLSPRAEAYRRQQNGELPPE